MDWLSPVVKVRYTLSALVLTPGDDVLVVRAAMPGGLYRLPGIADLEVSDPYELMATVEAQTGLSLAAGRVLAEDIGDPPPPADGDPLRIDRVHLFPRVPHSCRLSLAGGLNHYRWSPVGDLAEHCGEQAPLIEAALKGYANGTSLRLHNGLIVTERRAA
ncbi:hypothetical protein [Streptomyces sp. NPDC045470]|uniref:hypothetical protein n=1 Tax=Streptomyces sp. NPDC045470 TaxID=3155469 RepID=UPI0033ED8756